MNTSESPAYFKPHVNRIGSFEEITQATLVGGFLDASYPAGTPIEGPIRGPGPGGEPGGFS